MLRNSSCHFLLVYLFIFCIYLSTLQIACWYMAYWMTLFSLQAAYIRICWRYDNEPRPNKDLKLYNFKPFQEANRSFIYTDKVKRQTHQSGQTATRLRFKVSTPNWQVSIVIQNIKYVQKTTEISLTRTTEYLFNLPK